MVIASYVPLKIEHRYNFMFDPVNKFVKQPFVVIGESTKEAFLLEWPDNKERDLGAYFYEVSTD
jgi:hypothetical protein